MTCAWPLNLRRNDHRRYLHPGMQVSDRSKHKLQHYSSGNNKVTHGHDITNTNKNKTKMSQKKKIQNLHSSVQSCLWISSRIGFIRSLFGCALLYDRIKYFLPQIKNGDYFKSTILELKSAPRWRRCEWRYCATWT